MVLIKRLKVLKRSARFIIQLEDAPLAVYDGSLDGLKQPVHW